LTYKVYLNSPKEDWIVDRYVKEWKGGNKSKFSRSFKKADIIWIIAPWVWEKIPLKHLTQTKVFCTIHHIDLQKFNSSQEQKLIELSNYVDVFHTISKSNHKILSKIVPNKIVCNPFWVNSKIWYPINNKELLRKKLNLDNQSFLVGSFQRDSEGENVNLPKLSKGPDQFLKCILDLKEKHSNLKVVLTGHRRQYIIKKLNENNIPYFYFKKTSYKKLNQLYNCLDLYVVASRVEGGPAAVFECALTKTPIVSTRVGIADSILHQESIFEINNFNSAVPNVDYAFEKVQNLDIPNGMNFYDELFEDMIKNEN